MDDFGTGFSSRASLRRFPTDELKADRSCVKEVASDSDDAAIARATIAVAHEIRILVVAEGVQAQQQRLLLAGGSATSCRVFWAAQPNPDWVGEA